MMVVDVKLTWWQVSLGAHIGKTRHIQCMQDGRRPIVMANWNTDIDGAIAELAAAKHLKEFWDGAIGDFDAADVGPYQVRCGEPSFILRAHDKEKRPGIYINARTLWPRPAIRLMGWIGSDEAAQPKWWREDVPLPGWFVPISELHPMSTLPGREEAEEYRRSRKK
jgi:hypothetical protein